MRRAIATQRPALTTLDLMQRGDAAMAEGKTLAAALRALLAQAEARRCEWQLIFSASKRVGRILGPLGVLAAGYASLPRMAIHEQRHETDAGDEQASDAEDVAVDEK